MLYFNRLFSKLPCHRFPERCLSINGVKMSICSRCFGFLLLFPIGVMFGTSGLISSRWLLLPLLIPLFLDVETQINGQRKSNNKLRLMTGLLAGFSIGAYICIWITNDLQVINFWAYSN